MNRTLVPTTMVAGALALAACAAEAPRTGAEEATPPGLAELTLSDPTRYFAEIEQRLLATPELRTEFRITSEGAFTAALDGELVLREGDQATLSASGTFGADSVSLSLRVGDGRMVGDNGDERFDEPVPAELREALVIGMTRMGLLHNLARLVSAAPPDHADAGVRVWAQARGTEWITRGDSTGLSFGVWVEGKPSADAVLWLNERGQPIARDQTVRFPGGEMRVREEYAPR